MMTKTQILAEIKSKQLPVIIAGAGIVGKTLLSICREEGIAVECFCDNSIKVANTKFCNLDVIYTPELKNRYENAVIIISVVAIKDAVDLITRTGFPDWYAGGILLKDMDVSQSEVALDYPRYAIDNCILCHNGYLDTVNLFFRSIDIIITERCSLKCNDCSNLMQYYEKPQNCDTNAILNSIDRFCAVVDDVMDFRVIGGEVFMNKEWTVIVERLVKEPKAGRIVLYTNGTIIPAEKDLEYLRNNKVLVIISDYKELSKKLSELRQIFEKTKISYHVLEVNEWLDCSAISQHNRGAEGNKEIFQLCCAKNMPTLSDGKLFRCPYSANATRLNAVPDNPGDYVDLYREPLDGTGLIETKSKVRAYLNNLEYMEICDFCSGRPLSGAEVKPVVQIKEPRQYNRF
ncbi:MAG: radical SAM protein [Ignavibacteria bacterium]